MERGNRGYGGDHLGADNERTSGTHEGSGLGRMNVSAYLLLPRDQRTLHINLDSPCELLELSQRRKRVISRNRLLSLLNLSDDLVNWVSENACVCHHCEHSSVNGLCVNPLHLSLGTWVENSNDRPRSRRRRGVSETNRRRRENPELMAQQRERGRRAVATLNAKWMSTYDGFVSTCGNVARHNKRLGVDPSLRVKLE